MPQVELPMRTHILLQELGLDHTRAGPSRARTGSRRESNIVVLGKPRHGVLARNVCSMIKSERAVIGSGLRQR